MTKAELEELRIKMEGVILAMAEALIQKGKAEMPAKRDTVRKADMRKMFTAQMLYHAKHDHFYVYNNNDAILTNDYPPSIPNFLPETPQDPLNEPPHVYYGIPNDANPQKFCYWAYLENGTYYIASHAGNFVKTVAPPLLMIAPSPIFNDLILYLSCSSFHNVQNADILKYIINQKEK